MSNTASTQGRIKFLIAPPPRGDLHHAWGLGVCACDGPGDPLDCLKSLFGKNIKGGREEGDGNFGEENQD